MRTKILSFLLLSIVLVPTGFAHAGQLQDNIEGITAKLASTFRENASLLEILADLELSADIAADDKDIDELKRIKDLVTELIEKQKVIEKELPPLKKSLDEDCIEARKDKSETADAIDTIGACEDAESVYVAVVNSSKSFKESQKNIEANLAKFGLTLIKPTPTPTPSQSTQPAAVTSKKPAPPKKTTIVCVKGNLTKKVTAVKPKCPTGYKLKK
jgi:regulator of replication initiation timing